MKKDVYTLPLGKLEADCYIVDCGGGAAAVIDPGADADVIISHIESLGLRAAAVLLTHGHFDHVGACGDISERYNCPIYISAVEHKLTPVLRRGLCESTCDISDGDIIEIGELTFTVLATPGHSRGSVCYSCGELLFTGDTLFRSACGRMDLDGGSMNDMPASLCRLAAIPGDCRVLPGHGDATTLERERRENPAIRRALICRGATLNESDRAGSYHTDGNKNENADNQVEK